MRGGRLDGGSRKRLGRLASGTTIGGALTGHQDPFHVVSAAPGSYLVTGSDVGLLHAWKTSEFDAGSYAVTGSDVTFINTGDAEGGGALITGEADAMGIDFTYHDDRAKQMRVTTSSVAVDSDPFSTLTYTSPALKLCRQSDGVYRYSNHNLILRSAEFDSGSWSVTNGGSASPTVTANQADGPDGSTNTADEVAFGEVNTASDFSLIQQSFASGAGPIHQASVWVKAKAAGDIGKTISIYKNDGAILDATHTVLTGAWQRIKTGVATAPGGNITFNIAHLGSDYGGVNENAVSVYLWGAELKRWPAQESGSYEAGTGYIATTSAAKYDLPYEWNAAGTSQGILIEEQRTNNVVYSQAYTDWNKDAVDVTTGITAPDGRSTANTFTTQAGNTVHRMYRAGTGGDPSCISIFAKPGTVNFLGLSGGGTADDGAVFNLSNGAVTSIGTNVVSAVATDVGNGWYRIHVVKAGANNFGVVLYPGDTAGNAIPQTTWNAAGTETVIIWQAQSEAGTFPTSPIHTIGATVTRAIDQIRLATSAFPLSYATSTLVAEFQGKVRKDYCRPVTLAQGGTIDDFYSYFYDNTGAVGVQYFRNSSGQGTISSPGTVTVGNVHKVATAWASNDMAGCMDGGSVGTQGTFTIPDSFDTLGLGDYGSGNDPLNGYLRKVTYLARRATDGELQTRTT